MNVQASEQRTSPLAWFKSSHSAGDGGDCVEVAHTRVTVHVRDSKQPKGSMLTVGADRWAAFVAFAARD